MLLLLVCRICTYKLEFQSYYYRILTRPITEVT